MLVVQMTPDEELCQPQEAMDALWKDGVRPSGDNIHASVRGTQWMGEPCTEQDFMERLWKKGLRPSGPWAIASYDELKYDRDQLLAATNRLKAERDAAIKERDELAREALEPGARKQRDDAIARAEKAEKGAKIWESRWNEVFVERNKAEARVKELEEIRWQKLNDGTFAPILPLSTPHKCPVCDGSGKISHYTGYGRYGGFTCMSCDGSGIVWSKP